jgi:pyruvate formate lyase activating enzyme
MVETHATELKELLAENVREGVLFRPREDGRIECYACGHRCAIGDGKDGICRVRFNRGGKLYVPWGYVGGVALDPVEKKPFFHVLPGSRALSFGMLGCDYHCAYCQNWITSQALRDPAATSFPERMTPPDVVRLAVEQEARIVTSTYNEPLITSEWAVEIFRLARRTGLLTSYVSNGNATPEVLDYLKPWVDLYKVDLKGFNDRQYRTLGGLLQTVLDTITRLHAMGFWLEVVTLVVPGFNDGDDELRDIARFLAGVSPDIPWHVTAFHADYRMAETEQTSARALVRAAEIGFESGLHYVYAGNAPGQVGTYENTYCPSCRKLLVERRGYRIIGNALVDGRCPVCRTGIPGVWSGARTTDAKHER